MHLEIGHLAIPRSGLDPAVAEDVLARDQIRVCIEQLRCHGMAQGAAEYLHSGLLGKVFTAFLHASNGDSLTSIGTLFN